jgi:hypothetical protein
MRTFVWTLLCFLIYTIGCRAQTPEDQVLAVYKQLEKAVQTGDANHSFVGLWSREKKSEAEKMRAMIPPQPDVHYTSSKVFVQGDEAVLLGQYAKDEYLSVRFVKEDGSWKIEDFAASDKPYPPASVYAMLPLPAGAFERAGSPWQKVAPALDKASSIRQGWQLRATFDESFLYIRIESATPMPAPGTEAEKPPMGWPTMKLGVSGMGEFVLRADANIGDQATFDEKGRANSHRKYVAYWLMLERADKMVFQAWAGTNPNPLIHAGGNSLDVRVPLRTIGVTDAARTKIMIGDAAWPKSAIFSLEVQPYR